MLQSYLCKCCVVEIRIDLCMTVSCQVSPCGDLHLEEQI